LISGSFCRSCRKITRFGARASPALTEDFMKSALLKGALSLTAFLAISAATRSASAAILLSDNFDGYADQASFQAAWPNVAPQPSGTLTSAQFVSASNSIQNVATTVAASAMRNGRSFLESGNPSA